MLKMMNSFVLLASVFGLVLTVQLPFEGCWDPSDNVNACIYGVGNKALKVIIPGIPEFDIAAMNPLHLPNLTIADNDKLSFKMSDVVIHGLEDIKLLGSLFSMEDVTSGFVFSCDKILIEGQYDANGTITGHRICGEDFLSMKFEDVFIKWVPDLQLVERDNQTFFYIAGQHGVVTTKGVTFAFQKLFQGNVTLGNELNDYLNKNWAYVVHSTIQEPFENVILPLISDVVNKIIAKCSLTEIFPGLA